MTKEQFIDKYDLTATIISDLYAVIAYEIAKAKEQPELYPIKEPKKVCENCKVEISKWGCCCGKKDKPAPNPIREAYDAYKPIRVKDWREGEWIKKHTEKKAIDESGKTWTCAFSFDKHPDSWEIYTEAEADQVTAPAKPKFDQDRFESMFRAVVIASPHDTYERCMEVTSGVIEKLDAFYASKKGGSNE